MAGIEHPSVSSDPLSPVLFLERTLRVFPERTAVIYGDRSVRYRELGAHVGQMAGALRRAGIAAGDRVAILAPNTPAHLAAHFAMPLLAAPLVSINTRLAPAEVDHILRHSGARVLLVDPELAPPLDPLLGEIETLEHVIELGDAEFPARAGRTAWADFSAGAPELPIANALEDEDLVISINYTSGTTGQPKGVMYTHRGAYLNALGEVGALGLRKETVFLWTLPMFHCNGWCMPWAITAAGGTHVSLRGIDPPEIFALIERHGVTNFNGAPTVLLMLASDPAAQGLQ